MPFATIAPPTRPIDTPKPIAKPGDTRDSSLTTTCIIIGLPTPLAERLLGDPLVSPARSFAIRFCTDAAEHRVEAERLGHLLHQLERLLGAVLERRDLRRELRLAPLPDHRGHHLRLLVEAEHARIVDAASDSRPAAQSGFARAVTAIDVDAGFADAHVPFTSTTTWVERLDRRDPALAVALVPAFESLAAWTQVRGGTLLPSVAELQKP